MIAAPPAFLEAGSYRLSLDRPLVMGIVNPTPDSFSDGGRFHDPLRAVEHALALVEEGADIVDVGGESTRPGAPPVSAAEELDRVAPVVEALASRIPVSVDTSKPEVMAAVLAMGAAMINDVLALQIPGALELVAASGAAACLMHMQGSPRTMQEAPHYTDVVGEVSAFLRARAEAAERAGVSRQRLLLDPGFGFGKTLEHTLAVCRRLGSIAAMGWPVLAGLSRKSSLGRITGRPVGERVHASVAAALLAVQRGASVVRVHDVAATRDALAVLGAIEHGRFNTA